MATKKKKVTFIPYDQHQQQLLPQSLVEVLGKNHPVYFVSAVIDRLDLSELEAEYAGGGRASYHPRMLLKVLVYAYMNNVYSSRRIEREVRESSAYMWLAGRQQPDHNTIARFRSSRLKDRIKTIFERIVEMLHEGGHLDVRHVYLDGTTIEANANRYSFVWRKSIQTGRRRIKDALEEIWRQAEQAGTQEIGSFPIQDAETLNPELVEETIAAINKALENQEVEKKTKDKIKNGKRNWPRQLKRYAEQEAQLKDRNSYSKTDPDATFMQPKEYHGKKGQAKPCYNIQLGTNGQYITHYLVNQQRNDTRTLPAFHASMPEWQGKLLSSLSSDAGYGSEENYVYLANNDIVAYVKYAGIDKDLKAPVKRRRTKGQDGPKCFASSKLYYNSERDLVYCPMGQPMQRIATETKIISSGYQREIGVFQARNCQGCPLRGVCHDQEGNRVAKINTRLRGYRQLALFFLQTKEGIDHRRQRGVDVEAVFGMIKHNRGFRRFLLRGLPKVSIEMGLLACAHNLKKWIEVGIGKPNDKHPNSTKNRHLVLTFLGHLRQQKRSSLLETNNPEMPVDFYYLPPYELAVCS